MAEVVTNPYLQEVHAVTDSTAGRTAGVRVDSERELDPSARCVVVIGDDAIEIERDGSRDLAAHDQRARRLDELEDAHADLERLLSAAAHDLREPLRAINGFGELLERESGDQLSDRGREFLALIRQAGGRMEDLLDGLSRYSRASRAAQRPADVDLEAVLESVLERLHADIEARRAQVTHDPLPVVSADPAGLDEVLEHLIVNAVKFNERPEPHVHVQAAEHGGDWELTIVDDGIGVPERERERVFEMFRRLHPRHAYPGSGAGLAVCRRIVQRHGGRIWIEDGPTGGSAVHVRLPQRPEPTA